MKKTRLISIIVCLLTLFLINTSYAVQYEIIDLGEGRAYDINNNGQIVGRSSGEAFLYDNGMINTLNNSPRSATGINNNSQIIGSVHTASINTAFLYESGTMTDLGTLLNSGGAWDYSSAGAINDNGQIVGTSCADFDCLINAAYLYENGSMINLHQLMGATSESTAMDINNNGQIVGRLDNDSYMFDNGTVTYLEQGGDDSVAYGINDYGQVVGSLGAHAYFWENGTMTDIHASIGGNISRAEDINNNGQIVGMSFYSYTDKRAYLYDNGTVTILPGLGGTESQATAINDSGQIVGYAQVPIYAHPTSTTPSSFETHAVLWNPVSVVPEPISSILFIVGGATLGFRRFRKKFKK